MDFAYSDEQSMLTDSLRRMMTDNWSFEQRRRRFAEGKLDRQAWAHLVELGVTGLLVPEAYGGFGESTATMLAVHQELGYGLVSEPVITGAVMAVVMLAASENTEAKEKWLPAIAEGEAIVAVGWQEAGQRYDTQAVTTQASERDGGFVLKGAKRNIWHGAASNAVIVNAELNGEQAVFIVPTDAAGVSIDDFPTMDLSRTANMTFADVALPAQALLARGAAAQDMVALGMDYAMTALCAHAAGAMKRLIEITTEYLKTRNQFGQPLMNFQALQFDVVDMLIQQEMAVSHAYVCALSLTDDAADVRAKRVAMAKNEVAAGAQFVGEKAIQLHGGMGMTDELEVGDFFKRLGFVEFQFGDSKYHQERIQKMGLN